MSAARHCGRSRVCASQDAKPGVQDRVRRIHPFRQTRPHRMARTATQNHIQGGGRMSRVIYGPDDGPTGPPPARRQVPQVQRQKPHRQGWTARRRPVVRT